MLVAIVFVAKGLGSRAWAIALGLLLGAPSATSPTASCARPAAGEGHVVDFLDYNRWFIGNVADIWIVGAAVLIVLLAAARDRGRRASRPEVRRRQTWPRGAGRTPR